MEYRRLGRAGVKVSPLALGTWLNFGRTIDGDAAARHVRMALDRGINFIDTADVYGLGAAETTLGLALDGIPRKDYVLATKCYFPTGDGPNDRGLSRKHIFESCHASLSRLRTDCIDLYQCHRFDEETPVEETVRAMGDLLSQGKIHYWGVSMWTATQIEEGVAVANAMGAPTPVTNQPCYNLLDREIEAEILPACEKFGMGTLPYSPLDQGMLTGKYAGGQTGNGSRAATPQWKAMMGRYFADDAQARVDRYLAVAKETAFSPAQLALAWLLHRRGVTSLLVGARTTEQLEENLAVLDIAWDPELDKALDSIFPANAN
ncbi:MAG: aldo/keto reductase family protein [Planctomycetota bacterium]